MPHKTATASRLSTRWRATVTTALSLAAALASGCTAVTGLPETRTCISWAGAARPPCLTQSEWASWAQVVVGAVGIAVAIWVVRHQLAANRRSGAATEGARLRMRAHLLRLVVEAGDGVASGIATGSIDPLQMADVRKKVERVLHALEQVPLEGVPNEEELLVLLDVRDAVDQVRHTLDSASRGHSMANFGEPLNAARDRLAACIARLETEAARIASSD